MTRESPIRYSVLPLSPEAHLFEVRCTVEDPDPRGQRFALPAWIPGSYLVRDFARHVVAIDAASGARPVALEKLDKQTWRAEPAPGPLTVRAEVYAWDPSVRGAHLDTSHGFFNGPCLFLRVLGCEGRDCEVDILPPKGARYRSWRVATALRPRLGAGARRHGRAPNGFGAYFAADYEDLIDHPVEMGDFALASFRARGVQHDFALTGRHRADMARLTRDLKRLCEHHIDFWSGTGRGRGGARRAPMDRYVFLVTAIGEGYGGLEHRGSTALLCARDDLPQPGMREPTESYRNFLGLCSHEYFHTWNVKRIKPAAFSPYDLERENYTTLLWLFEGFTSYYDDLALARSGLVTRDQYLETLGRSISSYLRTPGRRRQTVSESSFDAWTKFYRQDENSPNAIVSYYLKGSLVALCLDLLIRERTRSRKSLDDVMRALWRRYGTTGAGLEEGDFERLAREVTGLRLGRFFETALRSTRDLPLKAALLTHGIDMRLRPAESAGDKGGKPAGKDARRLSARPAIGLRTRREGKDWIVTHVLDGGAAQAAGVAGGDVVVAVDGVRPGSGGLDAVLDRRRPGDDIALHLFRRDELLALRLRLRESPRDTCVLSVAAGRENPLLRRWLGAR